MDRMRYLTKLSLPVALSLTSTALAQVTSARLNGRVTDPSGAGIAHALVTASSTATNFTQKAETNDQGEYQIPALPANTYTVTVSAPGFAQVVQGGVTLSVGQSATLPIELHVGSEAQTVNVNANAEVINSTTAEISQVIDEASVKELPLNGRDPSSLVNLSAGVTNELQSQASTLSTTNSFPTESGASAGGGRQGSTWYLLDGVSNMDTFALLAAPFPNADATREFRVISNNFDARYGFAPGAVVNIQTKSGTNQFHGGAFEFLRNSALNAGNYFTHAVDPLRRNQFGGYVGGPILRNRLFFFANYQGTRASLTSSSNPTYTPTAAMLQGDFSAVPVALGGPFQTVNGKSNQVNPSLFSPGSLAIAASLPLGQDPATGLTNVVSPAQQYNYDEGTARIDFTINDKQQIFLRNFTYNYVQPGTSIPGNILAGVQGQQGIYLNETIGHTWTISPTLLNSVTLSYGSIDYRTGTVTRDLAGNPVCLSRYIAVNDPAGSCYISGLSAFDGNTLYGGGQGFAAFSGNPNDTRRRDWWFTETLTKVLGHHTLVAGTDILHRYEYELNGGSQNPNASFNGQYTKFELSDFLLGDLQSLTQGAGEAGSTHGWMPGLYVQDQWQLSPQLTLNAGLRWDPNFPETVVNGRGASWRPGQQSTRYPGAPLGLVFAGDAGVSDGLMPTTYGYFEPRLGAAWHPLPNTAFRAGFGLFTTPLEDAFYDHAWDVAPFAPTFGLNGTLATPLAFDTPWSTLASTGGKSPFPPFSSPSFVPPSSTAFITPVSVPAVFAPNFKLGITQSWNLSLEQQFTPTLAIHIAYVGSESYHQATTVEQNPGIYAAGNARTTYPNFNSIIQVGDQATSKYNALQAGVEKKFSRGLQFQSNFTWSRTFDVGGSGDPQFESSVSDPYDVHHDYGPSSLNYPVVSVSNFLYQVPEFEHHGILLRNTVGGWQVSGIVTAQSGPPFTINGGNGNNNSGFDINQDRADLTGQPFGVRRGNKAQWVQQYFNPGAFTTNAVDTPGDSPKFLLQEAPIVSADLGVAKRWEYRERYALQFRWEAFNALNHTSFGQPDSNPSDSNFGQITGIGAIPPRVMQGALKLTF